MKITVTYFKDTGKYYSEGDFEVPDNFRHWEVVEAFYRRLREPHQVPGLTSDYLNFFALLTWTESDGMPSVPHIVTPELAMGDRFGYHQAKKEFT